MTCNNIISDIINKKNERQIKIAENNTNTMNHGLTWTSVSKRMRANVQGI